MLHDLPNRWCASLLSLWVSSLPFTRILQRFESPSNLPRRLCRTMPTQASQISPLFEKMWTQRGVFCGDEWRRKDTVPSCAHLIEFKNVRGNVHICTHSMWYTGLQYLPKRCFLLRHFRHIEQAECHAIHFEYKYSTRVPQVVMLPVTQRSPSHVLLTTRVRCMAVKRPSCIAQKLHIGGQHDTWRLCVHTCTIYE